MRIVINQSYQGPFHAGQLPQDNINYSLQKSPKHFGKIKDRLTDWKQEKSFDIKCIVIILSQIYEFTK